ncbi:cyanocobalamin reductase / alkylcobalamin dealkylase [Aplysia californica]|uniref:Cyanocobalamin reductase (cyanide-eliminating) n=1 Tax=Aplysia californica TaxID=6500 RepID=A0ABM0K2B0_APLCA|nr:cyanocobalamin reductase / alkylcobalamin dealkylase [Aplysia californica]
MTSQSHQIGRILSSLSTIYTPVGFEIYPFKIGWYNEQVGEPFRFDLDPDTLAFVIISTPDMFDKALVPFMCRDDCTGSTDILDKCMMHYFSLTKQAFPDDDVETIHDFEMAASRRPKILVQPAAHVSGAAFYYTRRCVDPDPWGEKKKIFGVSIHPQYGGWFAIRGVIIFKSVQCPELPHKEPVDCVPEQEKRRELLELFNYHWRDWRFRDIIEPHKRYSEDQRLYFETMPKDRSPLVRQLKGKFLKQAENKEISTDLAGVGGELATQ